MTARLRHTAIANAIKSISLTSFTDRLPSYKTIAAFLAGGAMVGMFTAYATGALNDNPGTPANDAGVWLDPCGDLSDAAKKALEGQMKVAITVTTVDPAKYFNANGPMSCLKAVSFMNIDLSNFIPDPMAIISAAIDALINQLMNMIINAVCNVVNSTLGEIASKWNGLASTLNGLNGNEWMQGKVDGVMNIVTNEVGKEINKTQGWQSTISDTTSKVTNPLQDLAKEVSNTGTTTLNNNTGSVNYKTPNLNLATAASNMERARLTMEQERARMNQACAQGETSGPGTGDCTSATSSFQSAQTAYNNAKAAYDMAVSEAGKLVNDVTPNVGKSAAQAPATQSSPAQANQNTW